MRLGLPVAAVICGLGAVIVPAEAAQLRLSASVTAATDYIYHGVSQTGGTGAWQGDVMLETGSGLYGELWASRVKYAELHSAFAEADVIGGWRTVYDGWAIDAAADLVFYPNGDRPIALDNAELLLSLSHAVWLLEVKASLAYSPAFSSDAGQWVSENLEVGLPLSDSLILKASAGYQSTEHPGSYGLPDYYDGSLGLEYRYARLTLAAGASWTDIPEHDCPDGRCRSRFTLSAAIRV